MASATWASVSPAASGAAAHFAYNTAVMHVNDNRSSTPRYVDRTVDQALPRSSTPITWLTAAARAAFSTQPTAAGADCRARNAHGADLVPDAARECGAERPLVLCQGRTAGIRQRWPRPGRWLSSRIRRLHAPAVTPSRTAHCSQCAAHHAHRHVTLDGQAAQTLTAVQTRAAEVSTRSALRLRHIHAGCTRCAHTCAATAEYGSRQRPARSEGHRSHGS